MIAASLATITLGYAWRRSMADTLTARDRGLMVSPHPNLDLGLLAAISLALNTPEREAERKAKAQSYYEEYGTPLDRAVKRYSIHEQ